MGKYGDKARAYFESGYNCSQSVLLTFADELGIDSEIALKISSPFGGGMGRLREVCGAVSGMFMVAGLKYGYIEAGDYNKKAELYALVQQLAEEFKQKNGSIICREMLGLEQKKDDPAPDRRTFEYYKKRPCGEIIANAADIIGETIKQREEVTK